MIDNIKSKGKIIDTIKDHLGRIVYEAFKKLIVSGVPPITLHNCKGVDLVDYKVYGNSVQDGTPTPDTPIEVESVGEKTINMFNYMKANGYTAQGITFINNNDGSYTANGTLSTTLSALNIALGFDLNGFETGETYYASCGNDYNDGKRRYYLFIIIKNSETGGTRYYSSYSGSKTFVLSENEYISGIEIRINAPTSELFSVENIIFKPIICKASKYIEYEPYGYKIPIKVSGKNLIDFKQFKPYGNGKITLLENGLEYTGSYYISLDGSHLKSGSKYYMSWNYESADNIKPIWRVQYSDNTYTGQIQNGTGVTIPQDKTVKTILLYAEISTTTHTTKFTNIMLSESELTDYEPYIEPITTNIYLKEPLRKIGDYKDYIDFENGKVVRNICLGHITTASFIHSRVADTTGYKGHCCMTTNKSIRSLLCKTPILSVSFPNASNRWSSKIESIFNHTSLDGYLYLKVNWERLGLVYDGTIVYVNGDETQTALTDKEIVSYFTKYLDTLSEKEKEIICVGSILEETIELPNIPTHKGTNIIEVDTTIQSSNMEVEYLGKES